MIHLAAIVGGIANFHKLPHTLTQVNNALTGAITQASIDHDVGWQMLVCDRDTLGAAGDVIGR